MSGKQSILFVLIVFLLSSCAPAIPVTSPAATPSPSAVPPVSSATSTSAILSALSSPSPGSRTPSPTEAPVTLELQRIEDLPAVCSDLEQGLPGEGLVEVAYFPSGFCFHGELDLFEIGERVYVAQVIQDEHRRSEAAFRIVDVTDASQPFTVGAWKWNGPTYPADVKAFRQGDRWFLALSRDPQSDNLSGRLCSLIGGIIILEVTEPAEPVLLSVLTGESTGSSRDWCHSHTAQVGLDADGNGTHLYVSAPDSFDLRVLDIRNIEQVSEAGHYTHPDAGYYNDRNFFYSHDTTITEDRVYVAYWSAGLIILDRQALEAGIAVKPLNPLDSIDPWGLQIHHAFPTTDGNFVFVEDEYPTPQPESRLRLYDIRDLQSPQEVAAITIPDSFGSPHNLLVSGDRLFVGWYQDGVRVFRYDVSDPEKPSVEREAFKAVRTEPTKNLSGEPFDGIWGVRLHECEIAGQSKTCIYASDITYGLIILAIEP